MNLNDFKNDSQENNLSNTKQDNNHLCKNNNFKTDDLENKNMIGGQSNPTLLTI